MKIFKFKIRGNAYAVEIKKVEGNKFELEVNGTHYEVEMDRDVPTRKTPTLVRSAVKTHKPLKKSEKKDSGTFKVVCPLPGNIMTIFVKEGDVVKEGDKLLIYEAMKMENQILADRDGVIASVKVNTGDAVLQDDVLLEIR